VVSVSVKVGVSGGAWAARLPASEQGYPAPRNEEAAQLGGFPNLLWVS
jgi:hypothetical protein